MIESDTSLATALRAWRHYSAMTQHQAAAASGLSRAHISHLELGLNANPRLDTLQRLARAYGVTLHELVRSL